MELSEKMLELGKKSSVIREIFEYSKHRKAEIGADAVFDFSIGNPSVPAPAIIGETMKHLLDTMEPTQLHGYTAAAGDPGVRETIARSLNRDFQAGASADQIYMTCGAAASLTITLHAILKPGEEVLVLAPFFPEYRVFVEKALGKLRVVPCRNGDFQIDFEALSRAISPATRGLILNSPNNPTGAVIPQADIERLAALLTQKGQEFGKTIYLIADEPYRKLVWNGEEVPFVPSFYPDTFVCYSFSKAVSLPGDRIGYILVSPKMKEARNVFAAICGAGRALGFVCAPSLLQFTVGACVDAVADFSVYRENRRFLLEELTRIGYEAVPPDGAFYLFMKALEPDAAAFCARAKEQELLLVPSDDFGCFGYVRIAYCVSNEQIRRSIPAFEKLYQTYKGTKNHD